MLASKFMFAKMKTIYCITVLLAAGLVAGCVAHKKPATGAAAPAPVVDKTIVMPDFSVAAKVVSVNPGLRYVVLNFPASPLPKRAQTLFLYRAGLKVAEVKVTGPEAEDNTVADLVAGEARVGDAVRRE